MHCYTSGATWAPESSHSTTTLSFWARVEGTSGQGLDSLQLQWSAFFFQPYLCTTGPWSCGWWTAERGGIRTHPGPLLPASPQEPPHIRAWGSPKEKLKMESDPSPVSTERTQHLIFLCRLIRFRQATEGRYRAQFQLYGTIVEFQLRFSPLGRPILALIAPLRIKTLRTS